MREKLPDFPWDALAPYSEIARQHPDGAIDLSQGTPVDATPQLIQSALKESSDSPRYPATAGTKELQEAIRNWAINHLVGALLAQSEPIAVGIDAADWPSADFAWVNTPSNPTGRVHSESELRATINWARKQGATLVCDECYIDFGDTATPTSLLKYTDGDNSNILVVHSLSKRSSMAGYRGAFLVGDAKLISQIREVRKHAGMMVPLPIQNAMVAALSDETHVDVQRNRYNARRAALSPALVAAGFKIEESAAGLYIWCTRSEDCWKSVEWLAKLGIVATPGYFYGALGASHIRIAMTATDAQISDAAQRIKAAI
jgi:aspartate/methionine/tyrosine aminotransferase